MVLIINTHHMGFIGIKREEVVEYIINLFYTAKRYFLVTVYDFCYFDNF